MPRAARPAPPRAARSGETPPRAQLDRQSWIAAAIDVLAEDGVEGLRVETLARRCKVTKGSFYWHFKDRRDLFDAVLAEWKDGRIADIRKQMNLRGTVPNESGGKTWWEKIWNK